MAEKLVTATLGQPAIIDRKVCKAGETVLVPETMKDALEYVPPKEDAKAAKAEKSKAEKPDA